MRTFFHALVPHPASTYPDPHSAATSGLADLLRYSLDEIVKETVGPNNTDPGEKHLAGQRLIGQAQVVCTTCVGAGTAQLKEKKFGGVLIDEAAQATEVACMVPIMLGCQQLVLVGDHCQLPPTVVSEEAEAEGLTLSLFERLVTAGVPP